MYESRQNQTICMKTTKTKEYRHTKEKKPTTISIFAGQENPMFIYTTYKQTPKILAETSQRTKPINTYNISNEPKPESNTFVTKSGNRSYNRKTNKGLEKEQERQNKSKQKTKTQNGVTNNSKTKTEQ